MWHRPSSFEYRRLDLTVTGRVQQRPQSHFKVSALKREIKSSRFLFSSCVFPHNVTSKPFLYVFRMPFKKNILRSNPLDILFIPVFWWYTTRWNIPSLSLSDKPLPFSEIDGIIKLVGLCILLQTSYPGNISRNMNWMNSPMKNNHNYY